MKKAVKIFLVIALIVAAIRGYKYIIFNDEPFSRLRAGEIESAFVVWGGEDGRTEITDIGALPDVLDDLELESRIIFPAGKEAGESITLLMNMRDGTQTYVTVDNRFIRTEKGVYRGDREGNTEFLSYFFRNYLIFGRDTLRTGVKNRIDSMVMLAVKGNSWDEIRDIAKDMLRQEGFPEEKIKTLANMGFSPIDVFIMDYADEEALYESIRQDGWKNKYKALAENMWFNYKQGYEFYSPSGNMRDLPEDFVFTDEIDWADIDFQQDEMGYYFVNIPSADGRYFMTITVDDTVYENMDGSVVDNPPFVKKVGFYLRPGLDVPADYPNVDVIKSGNALVSADILTEKLTLCMGTATTPENSSFNKRMFICMLNYIENRDFCYYNIFPLLPDRSNSQFKTTNMEKVIRQVLGDYSWKAFTDFGELPNGGFNKQTQSYEFSTDFGWGMMSWSADNISSSFSADGKQVYSVFDLRGPDLEITSDPEYKDYGKYRAVYDIVTENSETFLRFNKYEKI